MESLARPGGTRTLWVWSRVITMGFQSVSGRLRPRTVPMESLARPGGTRTLWVWSRVITIGFQRVSGRLACLAAAHGPDGVVGVSGWYQNSVSVVSCNYHGFSARFRT